MIRLPSMNQQALEVIASKLVDGRLRCPHCGQLATPEKVFGGTATQRQLTDHGMGVVRAYGPTYTLTVAVCAACGDHTVFLRRSWEIAHGADPDFGWHKQVYPTGRTTKNFPNTEEIHLEPYRAACSTLEISPEASACMSRRCLEGILRSQDYDQKHLVQQVNALLAETDPEKRLSGSLHKTVDMIRNFGNFGAHPMDDTTTLAIISVDPGEAEWCIEIAEQLMDHYFEEPHRLASKITNANLKFAAAGKPAAKQ